MEELKKFDEILVADERQKHFVFPDPISGYRKLELKDVYEIAAYIKLHDNVPEVVRDHFSTARNLLVYSWFYYPFSVTAEFLAFVTLEFALKERFDLKKGYGKRKEVGFKRLIEKAVKEGLVRDVGFSHIRNQSESPNDYSGYEIEFSSQQVKCYVETLVESLPFLRNELAHGSSILHMDGAFSVRLCAEFINQLFSEKTG